MNVTETGVIVLTLDTFQIVSHCICILIGTLVNVFVAFILLSHRRLYNARNTIWLGVTFSNLLTLVMAFLELLAVCWSSEVACSIYTVMVGKPYTLVLVNTLLAAFDRYLYVTDSIKHKKYVTVGRVIAVELTCSLAIFLLMTMSFWTMDMPLGCGYNYHVDSWTPRIMLALNILCIVAKIVVYCSAKKCNIRNGTTTRDIPMAQLPESIRQVQGNRLNSTRLFIHCSSQRFSRMEMEATTALVAGLIPLCLFTFPMTFWSFWQLICFKALTDCQTSYTTSNYFRELLLIHVSTNVLVLLIFSEEFKGTVRSHFARRPQINIQH